MFKIALIVAGGSGLRMGTMVPKQFLPLKGRPVLMHSIQKFYDSGIFDQIIVVLPKSEILNWHKLISEFNFSVSHTIVEGGSSRFESVKNGLDEIKETNGYIAIHDGVRPLVSIEMIKRCMKDLESNTNSIPSIPIVDTLRKISEEGSEIIDRNTLRAIQTPQCFRLDLIKSSYLKGDAGETDDAGVFERAGHKVHLTEGEKTNLKITVVSDLHIAESLMA